MRRIAVLCALLFAGAASAHASPWVAPPAEGKMFLTITSDSAKRRYDQDGNTDSKIDFSSRAFGLYAETGITQDYSLVHSVFMAKEKDKLDNGVQRITDKMDITMSVRWQTERTEKWLAAAEAGLGYKWRDDNMSDGIRGEATTRLAAFLGRGFVLAGRTGYCRFDLTFNYFPENKTDEDIYFAATLGWRPVPDMLLIGGLAAYAEIEGKSREQARYLNLTSNIFYTITPTVSLTLGARYRPVGRNTSRKTSLSLGVLLNY